jgi:3-hydroxybutyryl-CoA dehydrogenase
MMLTVSTQLTDESIGAGEPKVNERMAVAGSGAIACGLAVVAAARLGEATLIARSEASAARAREKTAKALARMDAEGATVVVRADLDAAADATVVVEAIAEDFACKAELLADLHAHAGEGTILATTTSSLSVEALAAASGRPDRFAGLHVFNPVPRMDLVEVAYPAAATDEVRARVRRLVASLGKTGVEVPDTPGFVVNQLLFPMLFHAVRLLEDSGGLLSPADVDACMQLGAGHPMGPLALLDFVGLDVSIAIGDQIGAEVPPRLRAMAADGALGKKAGRGFYDYES